MKLNGYVDSELPEYLIDSQCRFTFDHVINGKNIREQFVMDTSVDIVIHLKLSGQAYKSEKIKHPYPYCWRTDYPLIYLATDAWFMNVQRIIPELIENNKQIKWSPAYVGTERFANWIKGSPDWCLSRNRVWGTPIPIWTNEVGDMICIGNINELSQLTGKQYDDIHLDKLGNVEFIKNGMLYKRTFGVLDCWFESGMAGLSRFGYPECQTKSYPVDFIAESIDQTRGWFYTLNVLSTALNHTPAFKQVIVSGLILAADGKKMSKRLGNYTSPTDLITQYGADVFRLYMIASPAAKAESFCFKDSDLGDITRKIIPYNNAHIMLRECLINAETTFGDTNWIMSHESTNNLDIWIRHKFIETSQKIYHNMENLELTLVPGHIYKLIEDLCNGYIKLSRERMKCMLTEIDCKDSLSTLYQVLKQINTLIVPFMPHLAENFNMDLYNMIKTSEPYESVQLQVIDINTIMQKPVNKKLLNGFYSVSEFLETVRSLRQQISKPMYYPLDTMELYTELEDISEYKDVICRELNVKNLTIYSTDSLSKSYKANKGILGKVYKKDANKYVKLIEEGNVEWEGCNPQYYTFEYVLEQKVDFVGTKFNFINNDGFQLQAIVYLGTKTTEQNDIEAEINNIRRQVNSIRKDLGLKMFNKVEIIFESNNYWDDMSTHYKDMLMTRLIAEIKFSNNLVDFKTIETFKGTELKVQINHIN